LIDHHDLAQNGRLIRLLVMRFNLKVEPPLATTEVV
jgi:hypothetical protein